jgi:hypothetical protein
MHISIRFFFRTIPGNFQNIGKTMYLKEWDPRDREQIQKDLFKVPVRIPGEVL